jgi:hypothetical protein
MDRQIIFSHGSRKEFYSGLAKNHSRFCLYFESHTELVPGALLFIHTDGDDSAGACVAHAEISMNTSAPIEPDDSDRGAEACNETKSQVVAQLRRCVEISDSGDTICGTGVEFVSPAV